MLRKYGGQIESIMEEAFQYMELEQWEKAEKLYRQALKLAPNSVQVHLALAHVAFWQGDEQTFGEGIKRAVVLAPSENEKVLILVIKAGLLLEDERAEEALEVLEAADKMYPQQRHLFQHMYVQAYKELGRENELWAMTQGMLPEPESQSPEDIYLFIHWINTMIDLGKWNLWSNVQLRLRRFLKSIRDEEDRFVVLDALKNEYDENYKAGLFREAEIFIDLMYYLDTKNPLVQQCRRKTKEARHFEKELERIKWDANIFPLIYIYAFEWFYEGFIPFQMQTALRESIMLPAPDDWEQVILFHLQERGCNKHKNGPFGSIIQVPFWLLFIYLSSGETP